MNKQLRITKKTKRRQEASRLQVYKVQLPIVSTEDNPPALVYNRTRSVRFVVLVTARLLDRMAGEPKAFFYGTVRGTQLTIVKPAPWQEW